MNPETVLITTTINVPTVLEKWAMGMEPTDSIIVAGDLKSPHDEIYQLCDTIEREHGVKSTYLEPTDQAKWNISEPTGWNCIQRRNIALLEAMRLKPKFILTIDDDNIPTFDDQVVRLKAKFTDNEHVRIITSEDGWFDPCSVLEAEDGWGNAVQVSHRGFPLKYRWVDCMTNQEFVDDLEVKPTIGVAAMLWEGDPDIDAIERMVNAPNVLRVNKDLILDTGTWAPFNSQATMYRAELAPAMFVWPGVGRYDDIWGSFLARRVMDEFRYLTYYGRPAVRQERNPHDLMKDLDAELFGMRHNSEIIQALRDVNFNDGESGDVTLMTAACFQAIMSSNVLPEQTILAFNAWLNDVNIVMSGNA